MSNLFSKAFKGDRVIWGIVALFMIYSLLSVYSSSVSVAYKNFGGNTAYFFSRQLAMLLISLVIIFVVHKLPYKVYSSLAVIFLVCSVFLLVMTLLFGARVNEASRSLVIPGTSFRFQTSDIAKVALVIYLARILSIHQDNLKDFKMLTKLLYLPIIVVCGLIMSENLSTAVMIFAICLIIMFIGRVPLKFIFAYIGISLVGAFMFVLVLSTFTENNRVDVWKARLESFVSDDPDPDGDYQANQAKIAISTGGLFGKAPGKSTQRNILPQSNSDYIFAIIIEEYGLIFGVLPLLLAYIALMFRGVSIAKKCETAFPAYLALGLTVMIVVQALINMMVAVGLFPVTGQTLPLVSWGRSSVLVMSFSIGAILSVSRVNNARILQEELSKEEAVDDEKLIATN